MHLLALVAVAAPPPCTVSSDGCTLTCVRTATDDDLSGLPAMRDIRHLGIASPAVTDESLAVVAAMPELRTLWLASSQVPSSSRRRSAVPVARRRARSSGLARCESHSTARPAGSGVWGGALVTIIPANPSGAAATASRTSPTCGRLMTLRAEVRPPATLTVLASLARSARGPPPGDAGPAEA
jgi:hypothetical protein